MILSLALNNAIYKITSLMFHFLGISIEMDLYMGTLCNAKAFYEHLFLNLQA